jgi:hypothetical protein
MCSSVDRHITCVWGNPCSRRTAGPDPKRRRKIVVFLRFHFDRFKIFKCDCDSKIFLRLCWEFVTPLANKDKREYGHRCDQKDGEHDGPNQRRKRSRLFVMVCHRAYSRRQLFVNAAIASSRVGS